VSYAVRNNGSGWRAVDGPQDCEPDETWQLLQPHEIEPNAVPQVVSRRQALLSLLSAGKLDQVDQLIQNSPRAVQIAWQAAGTFERTNPLIEAIAPLVGLNGSDIDQLFMQAAQL
jgi:hypothetical protein